jgi:hypothetical protein
MDATLERVGAIAAIQPGKIRETTAVPLHLALQPQPTQASSSAHIVDANRQTIAFVASAVEQ